MLLLLEVLMNLKMNRMMHSSFQLLLPKRSKGEKKKKMEEDELKNQLTLVERERGRNGGVLCLQLLRTLRIVNQISQTLNPSVCMYIPFLSFLLLCYEELNHVPFFIANYPFFLFSTDNSNW